jgi:propionyl-CoA carboxylase alpha chain
MPGLLAELTVEVGRKVHAGETLAIIEAMKMRNALKADHDRVVAEILAEPGASLAVDQPILRFE